jgi:hypothetical protein
VLRASQHLPGTLDEHGAIGEPGERVVPRLVADGDREIVLCQLRLLQVGHVGEHRADADHPAGLAHRVEALEPGVDTVLLLAAQVGHLDIRQRLAGSQYGAVGRLELWPELWHHLLQRPADVIPDGQAVDGGRLLVHLDDTEIPVDQAEADRHHRAQHLPPVPKAGGDIGGRPKRAGRGWLVPAAPRCFAE